MNKKTTITLDDCMKGAFQALLRGDTETRDILCETMNRALDETGENSLPKNMDMLNTNPNKYN